MLKAAVFTAHLVQADLRWMKSHTTTIMLWEILLQRPTTTVSDGLQCLPIFGCLQRRTELLLVQETERNYRLYLRLKSSDHTRTLLLYRSGLQSCW